MWLTTCVSDGGFGTGSFADEVLSGDVVDFDPHSAWDDGDEVTEALPGGSDFDPTSSLGSAWGDADDATTGVITADPGIDIDVGTAGDLFPDVVGFDPHPAWDVVDFEPAGAHKRKRKQKQRHTVQDARKHQHRRPPAIHGSAPGTDTGSVVRQSGDT